MKTIDLHIHTTASDGTYTPTELVDYAVKKGLSTIAITDHDTMQGIPEAQNHINALHLPLELIPGMEISASGIGQVYGLHILALFIDKTEDEKAIIINKAEKEIEKSSGSPKAVIKIVHNYGGLTSLAHPLDYFLSITELDTLVGQLSASGLDGIEAIYTTHSIKETKAFKAIAEKHGLFITGGTDFHGDRKPDVDLGNGFGNMTIPYSIVETLKEKSRVIT